MSRFFLLMLCFVSLTFSTEQARTPQRDSVRRKQSGDRAVLEEMKKMRAVMMEQQAKIVELETKMAEQETKTNEQGTVIAQQSNEIREQQQEIKVLKAEVRIGRTNVTSYVDRAVAGKYDNVTSSQSPDEFDTTEYACLYDAIDMSCPDDGLVFIVTASFGQYASACDDTCCAPDAANDCTELMQEYNDKEWTDLKLACNYNNACLFQHGSHIMTSCPAQGLADYMTITYVCSNEELPSVTRQVAFTAYNVGRNYYSSGNRITFDGVETNIGGHFDNSSTFTCPVDGLYFFSFTIMGDDYYSDDSQVTLRHEGSVVVGAWGDYYYHYPQASNAAAITCSAGEEVYLVAEGSDYIYSTYDRYTTFSGFLLSEN